jgi:ribonuclease BN (tRNA processing enzyme)
MTKHKLVRTGYATEQVRQYNYNFLTKIGVKVLQGDIRDYEQLLAAAQGCDFLVHTAFVAAPQVPQLEILTAR